MNYSPYDIRFATYGEIKQHSTFDIAILPWGATEPHNGHLPYCTDVLASTAIGCDVAKTASAQNVRAIVLPGVPFGSQNPGQVGLPFCLHTSQTTQLSILRDIVNNLDRQGIHRLLIINGHGGNSFKGFIRDLSVEKPNFLIVVSDWFNFVPKNDYFAANIDDHAGEQETSIIMHYYPELVKMEYAGDGTSKGFAIEGLNNKVGWTPRDWSRVSNDTGIGNPLKSTPEKGEKYATEVVNRLSALLVDICSKELY